LPRLSAFPDVVTFVFGKGSPRRRWWLLTLVAWASAGLPLAGQLTTATLPDASTVTIAIDDYAAVPSDQIDRAQGLVTHLYSIIGVETAWLETRVSDTASALRMRPNLGRPDLRIIVLGAQMGDRAAPLDAVGAAPGSRTERGHIAYVFYDRLRALAMASHQHEGDSLGVVIAHEIGHLLLPYGSHSDTGLMRGLWSARDFRRVDVWSLAFTPSQAREIRQRVSQAVLAP
jgi:hypothetical protein